VRLTAHCYLSHHLQTKDPKAVQPHMNKCFEGIALLDFKRDLKIIAMMSAQDERVAFEEVIDPEDGPRKGNVELWLRDVERVMRDSLKSILCKVCRRRRCVVGRMEDDEQSLDAKVISPKCRFMSKHHLIIT
jgi:hypothetical protein